jgi:hypothetical protein
MHPHGSEYLNRLYTLKKVMKKQIHIRQHTGSSIGNSIKIQIQKGLYISAEIYKVLFENGLQMLSP